MKRLLLILILTFSFQTLAKADDIRDFEIEGMSIGDSALMYFSKSEIKMNKKNWYKDTKFYGVQITVQSEKFDAIQLHFKTGDNKYIIHSVGGLVDFTNDITNCHVLKKKVDNDIRNLFEKVRVSEKGKRKHDADKSGQSFTYDTFYNLKNGNVFTGCYDWSKQMNYIDNFRLIANTKEIDKWYDVAYN